MPRYKVKTRLNEGDIIVSNGMAFSAVRLYPMIKGVVTKLPCKAECDMFDRSQNRCNGRCFRWQPDNTGFKFIGKEEELDKDAVVCETPYEALLKGHNLLDPQVMQVLRDFNDHRRTRVPKM